jgi:hypothetical protein
LVNPQTYNVVHSLRLSGALMSVGLSPDKARLVVGRADGSVTIRSRDHKAISDDPTSLSLRIKKPIFGGTAKHFHRGKNAVAGAGDFQVGHSQPISLLSLGDDLGRTIMIRGEACMDGSRDQVVRGLVQPDRPWLVIAKALCFLGA